MATATRTYVLAGVAGCGRFDDLGQPRLGSCSCTKEREGGGVRVAAILTEAEAIPATLAAILTEAEAILAKADLGSGLGGIIFGGRGSGCIGLGSIIAANAHQARNNRGAHGCARHRVGFLAGDCGCA